MKISGLRFAVLAVTACFSVGIARATIIPINNASFETVGTAGLTHACGTNCSYSSNAAISGWGGGTGQFRPGSPVNSTYFNYVPDGTTIGYTSKNALTQTVAVTVQAGDTYTLSVDVGHRKDAGRNFAANLGLLIGGLDFVAATGTDPGLGNWGVYTATFTGNAGDAGDSIEIELFAAGYQGDFDNVQMSFAAPAPPPPPPADVVPEPASVSLIALGLGSLGCAVRWRKPRSV